MAGEIDNAQIPVAAHDHWSVKKVVAVFALAALIVAAINVALFVVLLLIFDWAVPNKSDWVAILAGLILLAGIYALWFVLIYQLWKKIKRTDLFLDRARPQIEEILRQNPIFFLWSLFAFFASLVLFLLVLWALDYALWIESRMVLVSGLFYLPLFALPFVIGYLDPILDRRAPHAWSVVKTPTVSLRFQQLAGQIFAALIVLPIFFGLIALVVVGLS